MMYDTLAEKEFSTSNYTVSDRFFSEVWCLRLRLRIRSQRPCLHLIPFNMAKPGQKKRPPNSHNKNAIPPKPSALNVKSHSQQTSTGHTSRKADKSQPARRKLLVRLITEGTTRRVLCLIAMFCLVSSALAPHHLLQLLKSLQSFPIIQLGLPLLLLFIALPIAVRPVLSLLASKRRQLPKLVKQFKSLEIRQEIKESTKSSSAPIIQKQVEKKSAKKMSSTQESKVPTKQKTTTGTENSGQKNNSRQKQTDNKQATRTDTNTNNKTEPANDQEEKPPTASVAQTPHKKLPDVHTIIEKEDEIPERKTSSPTEKPKKRSETMKAVGLQNLGNTCFFNAVMQNLNQSFLLYEVLAEKRFRFPLTISMLELCNQMCTGASDTVNPHQVLRNICKRSPRFAGGRQQDSHDLLIHLLYELRNEERESLGNPNTKKILTKVDKVFGGHFMTVYTCKDCKTPYHVCEPMLDISLPIAYEDFQTDEESSVNEEDSETAGDGVMYQKVAESLMTPLAVKQKKETQDSRSEYMPGAEMQQPSKKKENKNSATKKSRTIIDCLDAFTRTQHIADEYLCMACHAERVNQGAEDSIYQKTSAKKRTLIYNPPALLTLHLKRFEQTPRGFVKCNNSIPFEDMIDIGPYCSSWCMRNEGKETSIWYSLYGLVVHSGSLDGGHYVAYIKLRERDDNIRQFLQKSYLDRDLLTVEQLVDTMEHVHGLHKPNQSEKWQPLPVKGDWFYVSDSHFDKVLEEDVWRQQAYLLFYERMQGKTHQTNLCVTDVLQ